LAVFAGVSPTDVSRSFHAPAQGYDALMGRYLPTLAPVFADAAGIEAGQRVLDVGCGPGGLTRELVARVGARRVAAVDPSEPFVQARRDRNAGVDVRIGVAEDLAFDDATFDAALAGMYHRSLDPDRQRALRRACERRFPRAAAPVT
jgi:ubiquinone/menaquinone biosynthesis C-methylase UbiE